MPGRLNTTLPSHIEEAILKAMARDPDQRYGDIAAFLAALKLPPAAGNREMRETIVTLARIMQEEDVSDLPTTPTPEADKYKAVKKLPPADIGKRGEPFTFPIFGSLPADRAGQDGPLTFPGAELTHTVGNHVDDANQVTFKIQHPHGGVSNKTSFSGVKKSLTARPRRTFALIVCLMAIIIIFVTTLVNLNVSTPAKKMGTNETATTNFSSRIGALSPIVTKSGPSSSRSGVTVPSQKATPQRAIPTSAPKAHPTTAPPTQLQVTLNSFFNNKGIGNAPGQANFDGNGYSYPARQLPSGGQISVQGVPYQFPTNGSGTDDNIVAFGQTIPFAPGNYRRAYLLAAASWGPVSGTMEVKYTDGSTTMSYVTVLDWYSNVGVLNTTYRYYPRGIDKHPVHIYAIPITLDSTRIANALILPDQQFGPYQNGHIHVFALTLLS